MFGCLFSRLIRRSEPLVRQFTVASGAGKTVVTRAAVIFPSAAAGLFAATNDESIRVAYTAAIVPVRILRDARFVLSTFVGMFSPFTVAVIEGAKGPEMTTLMDERYYSIT